MLCNIIIYYSYPKMLYSRWKRPLSIAPCVWLRLSFWLVYGIHISAVLITHKVLSRPSWWHFNAICSYKTQLQASYMHVIPLLSRRVLSWRFTFPFPVHVHTCVLLLAVEHSKTNIWQGYIILFPSALWCYFAWALWCVIVLCTTLHQVPVTPPTNAYRFRST